METTTSDVNYATKSRDTIAVFAAVVVLALAIIYYAMRIGFTNPIAPVLKTVTVSFWLLFSPQGYRFIRNRFHIFPEETWFTTDAFAVLLGLFVLVLAGFLVQLTNVNVILLFSAVGLLLALVTFARWFMSAGKKISAVFLVFAALFGIWAAMFVWGSNFQSPIFLEKLISGGSQIDELFHISISNMYRYYQTPSTGLYGMPYLTYHTGSHWMFAQLSDLLDIRTLDFYQLGYPIIFIPLLFYSILSFALALRFKVSAERGQIELKRDIWFWCIFVAGTVGILPLTLQQTLATWSFDLLISESYNTAVAVTFLTISLIMAFGIETFRNRRAELSDVVFLLILVPLLVSISGFLKISLMMVTYGVLGYSLLRLKLYRNRLCLLSFLIMTLSCAVVYWITRNLEPGYTSISLFDIIRTTVGSPDWKPYWPLLYFSGIGLFIGMRFHSSGIRTASDLREAFIGRKIVDTEIALVTAILSVAPGLVLFIPGKSALFFSDIQRWLALGLLLGYVAVFSKTVNPLAEFSVKNITQLRLSHIAIFLVGAFVVGTILNNEYQFGRSFLDNYVRFRMRNDPIVVSHLKQAISTRNVSKLRSVITDELIPIFTSSQQALEKEKGYGVVKSLLELNDKLSSAEKKQTVLFIPKSNTLYWTLVNPCSKIPFVAPALSGLAQIQGLPLPSCTSVIYAGYWTYTSEQKTEKPLAANDTESICKSASDLQFSKVEIMDMDNSGNIFERLLECQ